MLTYTRPDNIPLKFQQCDEANWLASSEKTLREILERTMPTLTSQPLNAAMCRNKHALCVELAELSVAECQSYYLREFYQGQGRCNFSRAEIIRRVKAFCERVSESDEVTKSF